MLIPNGQGGRQFSTGNRDYFVTWGNQATVKLPAALTEQTADTEQLVYVANEVPETFTLTLFAQVVAGTFPAGTTIAVEFFITFGVGAARIQVPFAIIFDSTIATPVQTYSFLRTPEAIGYVTLEFPVQLLTVTATAVTIETTVDTQLKIAATTAPRFKSHYQRETPAYVAPGEAAQ